MEFHGFDWDNGNRDKCQKHGLTLDEIEHVFERAILILPDRDNPQGERRFRAIGTSRSGRKVFIVFTRRGDAVRPISARHMHEHEVKSYEEAYPDVPNRSGS